MILFCRDYDYTDKEIKALLSTATILVDTREQQNSHITDYLTKKKVPFLSKKLDYGDYSVMIPANEPLGIQRCLYFSDEIATVIPKLTEEQLGIYWNSIDQSVASYNALTKLGVKKEDARFVLPEATCTELIVTGNLQAWLDFINLRTDQAAQWEIREVAKRINNLFATQCPNIFKGM